MLAQLPQFVGEKQQAARQHGAAEHQDQRREYPPDAARVEVCVTEPAGLQGSEQDARDQVTGDDEEDVHADEATAQAAGRGVEHQNEEHRDRAQTVNIGSVRGRMGLRRVGARTCCGRLRGGPGQGLGGGSGVGGRHVVEGAEAARARGS